MRSSSVAIPFALFGVSLVFAILACSQGGSTTAPALAPDGASTSAGTSGTSAPATSTGAATSGDTPAAPFASCTDLAVQITNNVPDGGVVMNNAMTAGDAGSSDRLDGIRKIITDNRDKFRCCFQLWGSKNPGKEAKISLKLELKPSGELRSAGFKADESDKTSPEVEGCMKEVAGKLSFPASPSGKDTTYLHPFNFKARP